MRIAFDAKRAFHNFSGLGNYSRNLLEGLCLYYSDNEYLLYTPKVKDKRALNWSNKFESMQIKMPQSLLAKVFPSLWRSVFLSSTLNKDSPDIYHGLSHELPPRVKKLNLKSIVTIHDLIFMRYPQYFSRMDYKVYFKKFKYSCEISDLIIAISEQTKNDIVEFFGIEKKKIKVLYQTCSPDFYTLWAENKREEIRQKYYLPRKYLLYVGSFVERKNLINLIEAYSKCLKTIDIPLVLVGKGQSYKEKMIKRAKELGVFEKLIILEEISNEELPGIYQNAMCFVYPSIFEGFGIPIIEAQYSQTPVITSLGSCFHETGGDAAVYADPYSPDDMSEKILAVLSSEKKRLEMIDKGLKNVEKFHIEKTTELLMKTYKALL